MAKNYVYSTLANDQSYTNWIPGGGNMPVESHSVFIKGGTGVANDRLITPLGVMTEVTDHDIDELRKNPVFVQHEKDGFVSISIKKADTEKVASSMNLKDESAPMTDSDYASEEEAPKVSKI